VRSVPAALDRARSAKRREVRETEWAQPVRVLLRRTAEELRLPANFRRTSIVRGRAPEKAPAGAASSAMEGTVEEVAAMLGLPSQREVAAVRGRKKLARSCNASDKYKEALTEAAASGTALAGSLLAHLARCARVTRSCYSNKRCLHRGQCFAPELTS